MLRNCLYLQSYLKTVYIPFPPPKLILPFSIKSMGNLESFWQYCLLSEIWKSVFDWLILKVNEHVYQINLCQIFPIAMCYMLYDICYIIWLDETVNCLFSESVDYKFHLIMTEWHTWGISPWQHSVCRSWIGTHCHGRFCAETPPISEHHSDLPLQGSVKNNHMMGEDDNLYFQV